MTASKLAFSWCSISGKCSSSTKVKIHLKTLSKTYSKSNTGELTENWSILQTNSFPWYLKKCSDRYPYCLLGITNQMNQSYWIACFVKTLTNPSPRVRSWTWHLHENEIQVQGNQQFFFLAASQLVFTTSRLLAAFMGRKIKKNLWDQGRHIESESLKNVQRLIVDWEGYKRRKIEVKNKNQVNHN